VDFLAVRGASYPAEGYPGGGCRMSRAHSQD
jgi:hypothetical protein